MCTSGSNMLFVCILTFLLVSVTVSSELYVKKGQDAVFNISVPMVGPEKGARKINILFQKTILILINNATVQRNYIPERVNVTNYSSGCWISFVLNSVIRLDAGWYKVCGIRYREIPGYEGELLVVTDTPTDPVMIMDNRTLKSSINLTRGDNVTLTCSSNSTSQPPDHNLTMSYTWRCRNGSESSVVNGSMLTYQSISKEQNGDVISCCAKEQHGPISNWSKELSLNIQYEPEVVVLSPHDDDDIFEVDKGEDLILNCSADCNPVCDVVWVDSDGVVEVSDGDGHAQLHVTVDLQTVGSYTCQVSNVFGNASRKIYIRQLTTGSLMVAWVVVSSCVLAVSIIAGVFVLIFIYKKKKGGERYRVRGEGHIEEAEKDVYARVKKTKMKTVTDEYACVKKLRPAACVNQFYHMSPENQDLLSHDFNDAGRNENRMFNCGETNVDGLIYADLDLPGPSFIDGKPVIFRSEEATVYEEIDFSKTPGPQLPDKIWEQE